MTVMIAKGELSPSAKSPYERFQQFLVETWVFYQETLRTEIIGIFE